MRREGGEGGGRLTNFPAIPLPPPAKEPPQRNGFASPSAIPLYLTSILHASRIPTSPSKSNRQETCPDQGCVAACGPADDDDDDEA